MFEEFVKKKMFKYMVGDESAENDSVAMHKTQVEDADFQGLNTTLPADQWVAEILSRMTLEEKVRYASGYKQLGIHPISSVGLPSIWCSDATAGLRCYPGGTSFLAGVAMAATWNEDLIEQVAQAIAEEFRSIGVSILLGPGVNIYRVPTCGRNFEYMGEDPILAGKIAAAYIRGAQSKGVITTIKHFAVNNSDYDRHKCNSEVDERTLREIYLPAFKLAVQEGGSLSVMSSYNPINGTYASENKTLLKDILRDEWGFDGFVISDWNSVYSTTEAVKNGLNLEMPNGKWINFKKVDKEIQKGNLTEQDVDNMITPLLTTLYKAGVYTRPQVDATARLHPQEFIDLAQKAAEEAIVLLKNEANQLPIKPSDQQKIVVMGLTAVQTPTGGGGSSFVSRPNAKDILTALQETYGTENITHIPFNKDVLTAQQTASITNADKVIVAAGFLTYQESECFDRPWQLQHNQAQLIQKVSALNPNLTVILSTGAGVETESWVHKVPALIHALYLGETGADALATIISGKTSPSGKLPFTMAKKWEDFASTANYPKDYSSVRMKRISGGQGNPKIRKVWSMEYKEGLGIGYRHFDTAGIDPQFAFGHGLSYAEFEYPPVSFDVKMNDGLLELSFRVRNISEIDGATTLQVYVRDLESTEPRPEKELKAFKKVFLQAGRSAKIEFQLDERAFQYYDVNQKQWTIEPGDFDILIGTSSDNIILGERITIE